MQMQCGDTQRLPSTSAYSQGLCRGVVGGGSSGGVGSGVDCLCVFGGGGNGMVVGNPSMKSPMSILSRFHISLQKETNRPNIKWHFFAWWQKKDGSAG